VFTEFSYSLILPVSNINKLRKGTIHFYCRARSLLATLGLLFIFHIVLFKNARVEVQSEMP
jgi:hypothetical protein